jgi:hypothetical protein
MAARHGSETGRRRWRTRQAKNRDGRCWRRSSSPVAAASVAFRALGAAGLEHTSAVFVGIPAILALAVLWMPRAKTAQGVTAKAITLGLLIAGVLFGEGFVCLLMASPLFYGIGSAVTALVSAAQRRRGTRGGARAYALALVLLTPAALEGVAPGWELGREEAVTVVRTVDGTPDEVAAALAQAPRFDRPLPAFFHLGFPTPVAPAGSGLRPGDIRRVGFHHGHHGTGTLTLRVEQSEPGLVLFSAVSDDSYLLHWLTWRGAEVRWSAVDRRRTRVAWTLHYRRRLDPAWYFGPLERNGARKAAGYLIDCLATPRRGT